MCIRATPCAGVGGGVQGKKHFFEAVGDQSSLDQLRQLGSMEGLEVVVLDGHEYIHCGNVDEATYKDARSGVMLRLKRLNGLAKLQDLYFSPIQLGAGRTQEGDRTKHTLHVKGVVTTVRGSTPTIQASGGPQRRTLQERAHELLSKDPIFARALEELQGELDPRSLNAVLEILAQSRKFIPFCDRLGFKAEAKRFVASVNNPKVMAAARHGYARQEPSTSKTMSLPEARHFVQRVLVAYVRRQIPA